MKPLTPDSEESKQRLTAPLLSPEVAAELPDTSAVESTVTTVARTEPALSEVAPVAPITHPVAEPQIPNPRKKVHKLAILITAIVVINLALAGGSGWLYYQKHNRATAAQPASLASQPTTTGSKKSAASEPTTLHYVSEPLKIEFDYPIDWRVSSSSDNSSVNLTSAPFPFTTGEGKQTKATINISMSPASATGSFLAVSDDNVIVTDSESLTYTTPTKQQRPMTNLSFVNYKIDKNNSILGVFISGSFSYKQGELAGSKDYKTVDPRIFLSVDDCASGQCRQAYLANYFTIKDWHTNPNFKKAKAIFESLRLN